VARRLGSWAHDLVFVPVAMVGALVAATIGPMMAT
jgi:hypothetical protein